MINLSYKFDQNSSSLEIAGMPDVSNGDSEHTIGIITSWKLRIIGSPVLEGEKEHLDNLIQVILQYSRSYISGIRKPFISKKNIVTIIPSGLDHKLLLNSTRKGIKPLEIILDDSELADLTKCLDLLRFDSRFSLRWDINLEGPFTKRYLISNINKSKWKFTFIYSIVLFLSSSFFLLLIPINNQYELRDNNQESVFFQERNK